MTRFTLVAFILLAQCSTYAQSSSMMAPMLTGIRVLEYYKYENGAYKNYALVVNPKNTDIDITVVVPRPWRPGTTTLTPKWDTLLTGIKMKTHETKIIPNFFEQFRDTKKLKEITVMVNGVNGGGYSLYPVKWPDNLPKEGILSCEAINSGSPLNTIVMLRNNKFKKGHSYNVTVLYNSTTHNDTLGISPLGNDSIMGAFFGIKYTGLKGLDMDGAEYTFWHKYDTNTKGGQKLLHVKFFPAINKQEVKITTPDNDVPSITGFTTIVNRPLMAGRSSIIIPMNIAL